MSNNYRLYIDHISEFTECVLLCDEIVCRWWICVVDSVRSDTSRNKESLQSILFVFAYPGMQSKSEAVCKCFSL